MFVNNVNNVRSDIYDNWVDFRNHIILSTAWSIFYFFRLTDTTSCALNVMDDNVSHNLQELCWSIYADIGYCK